MNYTPAEEATYQIDQAITKLARSLAYIRDDKPLTAMATADGALDCIRDAIAELVQQGRVNGQPWEAVGDALGITRQAAQQRYLPM